MLVCLLKEVYIHIVDMAETRQVWEFAEAFKQQCPSLNVLVGVAPFPLIFFYSWARMIWLCNIFFFVWQINNAGCMVHKRELNAEGLEKNFATNTMGETSLWGSNSSRQVTVLSLWLLFRSLRPHPVSHTTSREEPGSQGGMNTSTHKYTQPQHWCTSWGQHNATSVRTVVAVV